MEIESFSRLFPLFHAGSPEVLAGMLSVASKQEYPPGRAVLIENSWGNAVYFILEGWVKVRRLLPTGDDITLAVLGPGDFFGEMAVLDESPRSTDVIALSPVQLLGVPAQKFTQMLLKDPQLHYRMLQLMVRRVRKANARFELQQYPPAIKLANTLVALGQNYGPRCTELTGKPGAAMHIFNVPIEDLADITDISVEDTVKIMDTLTSKSWIKIDTATNKLYLLNLPQLVEFASQS